MESYIFSQDTIPLSYALHILLKHCYTQHLLEDDVLADGEQKDVSHIFSQKDFKLFSVHISTDTLPLSTLHNEHYVN